MPRWLRHLSFVGVAWLVSCHPKENKTSAELPPPPKNWCSSVSGDLAGFECLTLAGAVDLEMFGPGREMLSEGSLSSCFGGRLPVEIPKKTQKAQLPSYSQDWSRQIQNETGLNLQQVGAWLPNASIDGGKSTQVRVEISFDELERIQLSNIAPAFRSKIASTTEKSTLGTLDSCRKRLCKPSYLAVVEVLSGYPKITITTDGKFEASSQIGWDAKKVDIGVNTDGGSANKNTIVMERSKTAGPVVVAARLTSLSESMTTDDLCSDKAMSLAGTESPPPLIPTKIEKFNLQVDLPVGASVDYSNDLVIIHGGGVYVSFYQDEKGIYANSPEILLMRTKDSNPKNIKTEILSNGWSVTYTDVSHVKTDKNIYYRVSSLIEIGKNKYACWSTSKNAEEQTANLKICKSLRP